MLDTRTEDWFVDIISGLEGEPGNGSWLLVSVRDVLYRSDADSTVF